MSTRKLLFLFFFLPAMMQAQHSEVGIHVGTSNYWGDLNPSPFEGLFKETHFAFGGFFRYNFGDFVGLKLGIAHGTVSGDDSKSSATSRKNRNLSFKSGVTEVTLTGEFNVLGFQPYNLDRPFSPYLFAGVGLVKYNPKASLNGDWIELQGLSTEGQGLAAYPEQDAYKLLQFTIPFGLGLKYALNDTWNIGIDAGLRLLFTDYLDDVSTVYVNESTLLSERGEVAATLSNRATDRELYSAGNPRGNSNLNNDVYMIVGFSISYNFLDNGLSGFRNRTGRNRNGCRTN